MLFREVLGHDRSNVGHKTWTVQFWNVMILRSHSYTTMHRDFRILVVSKHLEFLFLLEWDHKEEFISN